MVVMQVLFRAAQNALTEISLPNSDLHRCRNKAGVLLVQPRSSGFYIFLQILQQFEFELENPSTFDRFHPTVFERENAVVDPNTSFDLFVDTNMKGLTIAPSEFLSRFVKQAILR